MKKTLIVGIVLLASCVSACSDGPDARRVVEASGYTHFQSKGYAIFGCADKDSYHTGFTAVGPTGVPVEGVVCKGIFKGSTVRFQ